MAAWALKGVSDQSADFQSAATLGDATPQNTLTNDGMSVFRVLVTIYEKDSWKGLNDGTESRKFVQQHMRLAKHFFVLYDSARLANDEAAAALMEARLERLAIDPRSRWGGLL